MRRLPIVLAVSGILFVCGLALRRPVDAQQKPPITLDEFFNSVDFTAVRISPDGEAVVIPRSAPIGKTTGIATISGSIARALADGELTPLTQTGHDHSPQWSPDRRWIAFLSDRTAEKSKVNKMTKTMRRTRRNPSTGTPLRDFQLGGEAFPASEGDDSVHSFAWSADSRSIFLLRSIRDRKRRRLRKKGMERRHPLPRIGARR